MDAGKHTVDPVISNFKNKYAVDWLPFLNKKWTDAADTAVPLTELKRLAGRITTVPETSKSTRWSKKCWRPRRHGPRRVNLDWGMGEHLAFASLVSSGYAVRLTGQDAAVAPSPTVTPCCTTRTASVGMPAPTCRCRTSPKARRRSP
jgi:2-oxoglutarate dehydrogenase E1 component